MFPNNRGAREAASGGAARPAGLTPQRLPSIMRANGAASDVPNANYAGKDGQLNTIAQSKYGAPPGWSTPAGTRGEGYLWTAPDGTQVTGRAPWAGV